jgi:hypothetical protein
VCAAHELALGFNRREAIQETLLTEFGEGGKQIGH